LARAHPRLLLPMRQDLACSTTRLSPRQPTVGLIRQVNRMVGIISVNEIQIAQRAHAIPCQESTDCSQELFLSLDWESWASGDNESQGILLYRDPSPPWLLSSSSTQSLLPSPPHPRYITSNNAPPLPTKRTDLASVPHSIHPRTQLLLQGQPPPQPPHNSRPNRPCLSTLYARWKICHQNSLFSSRM